MPQVIQSAGLHSLIDAGAFNAFQQALRMAEPLDISPTIATVISTDRAEVRLPFLWYPPRMREWVGERRLGSLQGETMSIFTRSYEASVAVPRSTFEDQMVPLIELRVSELATEYKRFLHEQAVNILLNGTTIPAFDGKPLLSGSASDRGANNVNLASAPLSHASLQAGIAAMGLYTEPIEGRPIGIRPTHLLVGPRQEWVARQLTSSQTLIIAGTTDRTIGDANVLYNLLQVLVSPYITDDRWYLIAAGANAFRPVLRVDRTDVPVEFVSRTSPDTDSVFLRDSFEFGVRARHGFGSGAWYAVYASVP